MVSGLAEVLARHEVLAPRGYAGEVCTCGWESDLEQRPEGQGTAHVEAVVLDWLASRLTAPEVVERARIAIEQAHGRGADHVASVALTAAVAALTPSSPHTDTDEEAHRG